MKKWQARHGERKYEFQSLEIRVMGEYAGCTLGKYGNKGQEVRNENENKIYNG